MNGAQFVPLPNSDPVTEAEVECGTGGVDVDELSEGAKGELLAELEGCGGKCETPTLPVGYVFDSWGAMKDVDVATTSTISCEVGYITGAVEPVHTFLKMPSPRVEYGCDDECTGCTQTQYHHSHSPLIPRPPSLAPKTPIPFPSHPSPGAQSHARRFRHPRPVTSSSTVSPNWPPERV